MKTQSIELSYTDLLSSSGESLLNMSLERISYFADNMPIAAERNEYRIEVEAGKALKDNNALTRAHQDITTLYGADIVTPERSKYEQLRNLIRS